MKFLKNKKVANAAESIDKNGRILMEQFGTRPNGQRHFHEESFSQDQKDSRKKLQDLKIINFKSIPKENGFEYAYHWTNFGDQVMRHLKILNAPESLKFFPFKLNWPSKKVRLSLFFGCMGIIFKIFFNWEFVPEISIPYLGIGKFMPSGTKNIPVLTIEKNILPFSVFSLIKEMTSSSRTSFEKEENFKKYIGLLVKDEGFVKDVIKNSLGDDKVIVFLVEKLQDFPALGSIVCEFDSGWTQTASTFKINQKVKFSGVISSQIYNLALKLEGCKLE